MEDPVILATVWKIGYNYQKLNFKICVLQLTGGSNMENVILKNELAEWMNRLPDEGLEEEFQGLIDKWGYEDVISTWADDNWYNRIAVAEKLLELKRFSKTDYEEPKTIAYYYRCIKNGGAQRVAAMLCNIFSKIEDVDGNKKYKVVLITDEDDANDTAQEYFIEGCVKREYLPGYAQAIKADYKKRLEKWTEIIEKQKIDVVINGMWCAPCATWDWISIKGTKRKPMYITHMHNFCCVPYGFEGGDAQELMYRYHLSDGVVSLSECDERFVSAFNPYSKSIVNPMTFDLQKKEKSEKQGNTIVWIGRISEEKQPLDAIQVMHRVHAECPMARLVVVGSGNEKLTTQMEDMIRQYGLEDFVQMAGYTSDVDKYYREADVFISTAAYEGFPLTFAEAMTYEVPAVIYDMPWLTFVRGGRGIIPVKQRRVDLMADQIVRLLGDAEKRKAIGKAGREQIEEIASIDIGKEWDDFINTIWQKDGKNPYEKSVENILFEYLTRFGQKGRSSLKSKLELSEVKRRENDKALRMKLQTTYAEKSEINRKLQITYDEKRERGILIGKQEKEIKELKEQLKKTQYKLNRYEQNIVIRVLRKMYRIVKRTK